jgi:glycosyltransferase involved in cell wall biosynthesis
MGGGGAERQLAYLATELPRLGWNVHVALLQRGSNWARLEASGARIHQLDAWNGYDPRLFLRLRSLMAALRPDIVQVWLPQMEVHGGLAALFSQRPFVLCERSAAAYRPGLKYQLRLRMARRASAIVSNSAGGGAHWCEELGDDVRRYVIPNGVPLQEIAEAAAMPLPGIDGHLDAPLILFAGRFERVKNIDTLLRALSILLGRRRVRVLCCGEGALRGQLDRWARDQPDGRAIVTGYQPQLWGLMKRATVVVSPSWFEGRPNVVLEAMACGVPLVVSDIPAHRELLDESSAMFVPPASGAGLARAIETLIDDQAGARARAAMARQRAASFELSTVARQYADMYHEILAGDGAR